LSCVSNHPEWPVITSGVARLLGLLAFGDADKMDAIVQFLKAHLVRLKPGAVLSDKKESALLDCCCALMIAIRRDTPNGSALRQKIVHEAGALEVCLQFLWDTVPACVIDLDEEATLNTSDPEVTKFLELPMLPHVLQVLRASVDGSQPAECLSQPTSYHVPNDPDKPRVTAHSLLHFLHLLDTSTSSGRVGLLTEDMLNEWAPKNAEPAHPAPSSSDSTASEDTSPTVSQVIAKLRESTAQRTQRLAHAMRQKKLRSMNMRVDEKGKVMVMGSDRLAEMTATVTEEKGLTCAICHDGFRNAPQEAMGIYVFVRQCPLEETMVYGNETAQVPSTPSISQGYSTLSSFVTVHFSCHTNSLKSSSENRWTVAQRHNRGAQCNAILPILSPPSTSGTEAKSKTKKDRSQSPEAVYAGHLGSFMNYIMRNLNVRPGYASALQDVKILLCRFACNRHFHQETGGGGRESNMQLLPHLMQVCLHSMIMSTSVNKELVELDDFMDVPETQWATNEHCWSTTGPLYRAVAALHLWPSEMWRQQRGAVLRRLLYLGRGRIKQLGNMSATESTGSVFMQFKPYFVFFGLIDAIYHLLFKHVSLPSNSSQPGDWCATLSAYIAASDEALLAATPQLLSFFQDDLSPIVSVDEFLDVMDLLNELNANELTTIMNES
uniref:E3_UbLigase_R4 domain-containing protein n=1 Tax=Echinostoma caproni TaxID=27848 RepID=A0A182ZZC4_9TREM